jgi:hypothetical protein
MGPRMHACGPKSAWPLPERELRDLYHSGLTMREIAALYDCSPAHVMRYMRLYSIQSRRCRPRIHPAGPEHASWRGGRRRRRDGYFMVRVNREDILEHRHVMEQIIGRKLDRHEVVHHRDHDKTNNEPSNLELMTFAEHGKLHAPENIPRMLSAQRRRQKS